MDDGLHGDFPASPAKPGSTSTYTDVAAHAKGLGNWDQRYVQLSSGQFSGTITTARIGNLHLFRETTNQVVHESGQCRSGLHTLCIPMSMTGNANFNGSEWSADHYTLMGSNKEFNLITSPELDLVSLSFDAEQLGTEALLPTCSTARVAVDVIAELRAISTQVILLVDAATVALDRVAVRRELEESVYDMISTVLGRTAEPSGPRPIYSIRKRVVADAIDYVRADAYGNVNVGDLCKVLRISRRTLQHYFQDVLNISPKQYLLAYRLNQVRAAIIDCCGATTVRDAALDWGFWNLSDFASQYRRLFGEPPSTTLRLARGITPACRLPL